MSPPTSRKWKCCMHIKINHVLLHDNNNRTLNFLSHGTRRDMIRGQLRTKPVVSLTFLFPALHKGLRVESTDILASNKCNCYVTLAPTN